MGVSVSDYALVMDKYEFSMKDLLERGPGEASGSPAVLEEVFARDGVPGGPQRRSPPVDARSGTRASTSSPPSTHEQRQRLREAIEAPRRVRAAEADDVRGPHPHGPAVSARYRGRVEPAPPGELRERRPALSPRHQAGQHLRQARRHQGHRVRARATSASCRPSRNSIGRWIPRSTTCRWARCTSARPSRRSTSTWPTSKCTLREPRSFSTSAIPNSAAASSRRATAFSSAGTRAAFATSSRTSSAAAFSPAQLLARSAFRVRHAARQRRSLGARMGRGSQTRVSRAAGAACLPKVEEELRRAS